MKQLNVMILCLAAIGCNAAKVDKTKETDQISVHESSATDALAKTQKCQGSWQAVSAMLAGMPFPPTVTEGINLTIDGENYSVLVAGSPDKGKCKLDVETSPQRMTIHGTEGPNAGKTFLAICDFPQENEMRVCYNMNGEAFPEEFLSIADNGYFLVTYRKTE